MTWCAPGFESAFEGLRRGFRAATFPQPPEGFTALSPARPMRVVVRGTAAADADRREVVVKWHRAVRVGDHISKKVRGSKAEREGSVLRAMAAGGVRVPQVLAYTAEPDLLVTAYRDDLRSIEHALAGPARREVIDDVALQLRHALAADLIAHDLHPGNLAWTDEGAFLVDLGSASLGREGRGKLFARWRYALGQHLSYTERCRAFASMCNDRYAAHVLTPSVNERARLIAASHRRGRDKRVRRNGRHFEHARDIAGLRAGVRRVGWSGPSLPDASALLEPLADATALKADGSVLRVRHDDVAYVVKRYEPPAGVKPPRPLRSFRRAFAMENRGVPVARAQLALIADDGRGVLVSDYVPGRDLHAWFHDNAGNGFGALSPARRARVLEGLGRMLRKMHDEGIVHRDLKAPNLVWHDDGSEAGRFVIVDHDGARVARGDVPWKRRARDLARLDASLPAKRTDRLRVLRAYRRVWPTPPVDERTMTTWIDEHVRRKRGPSGKPK